MDRAAPVRRVRQILYSSQVRPRCVSPTARKAIGGLPLSHEETAGPQILPHAAPVGLPHIVCRYRAPLVKHAYRHMPRRYTHTRIGWLTHVTMYHERRRA